MKKRVMNLVNFVRGCEPREPDKDLYTPLREEITINQAYGFDHTVLMQYDALLRSDLVELVRSTADAHMEIGLWFEMGRALTERVGIPWRGRPGYDWDWYVNPGFLPAYTPAEREALIDEAFRLFRETFGTYPSVAGSWLLDSHSLTYMSEKYAMKAFCICREQLAVDAYTLWGGYYNGGYYPSRLNMLSPAQSPDAGLKTPVFRMLGIDPTYGYDRNTYNDRLSGCPTLEPVWGSGSSPAIVDAYFQAYYRNPCLTQAHITTGQENSFGWPAIAPGYRIQAEKLAALVREGVVTVEKLGDTGEAMQKATDMTPAAALVATEDWAHDDSEPQKVCRSVWYSSAYYRANLFLRGDRLFFRDIHKFDDRYAERYLTEPCTAWDAVYDTLPVVDAFRWSREDAPAALSFEAPVRALQAIEHGQALEVIVHFCDGRRGLVYLTPTELIVNGCGALHWTLGEPDATVAVEDGTLFLRHNGYDYRVPTRGTVTAEAGGFGLSCIDGCIALDMSAR